MSENAIGLVNGGSKPETTAPKPKRERKAKKAKPAKKAGRANKPAGKPQFALHGFFFAASCLPLSHASLRLPETASRIFG